MNCLLYFKCLWRFGLAIVFFVCSNLANSATYFSLQPDYGLGVSSITKARSADPDVDEIMTVGFKFTLWEFDDQRKPTLPIGQWTYISEHELLSEISCAFYDPKSRRVTLAITNLFDKLNLIRCILPESSSKCALEQTFVWNPPSGDPATMSGYSFRYYYSGDSDEAGKWNSNRGSSASGQYLFWNRGNCIQILNLAGPLDVKSIRTGKLPGESSSWWKGYNYCRLSDTGDVLLSVMQKDKHSIVNIRTIKTDMFTLKNEFQYSPPNEQMIGIVSGMYVNSFRLIITFRNDDSATRIVQFNHQGSELGVIELDSRIAGNILGSFITQRSDSMVRSAYEESIEARTDGWNFMDLPIVETPKR